MIDSAGMKVTAVVQIKNGVIIFGKDWHVVLRRSKPRS